MVDKNISHEEKMLSYSEALELAHAILGYRKIYLNMEYEETLISPDDFLRNYQFIDSIPRGYAEKLTNIVKKYNQELKELALEVVNDNLDYPSLKNE